MTIKRTTGGTFDPEEKQLFFLATSPSAVEATGYPHVLVAVNELKSQNARDTLERLLDDGKQVMLDSGIFNLAMEHVRKHGTSHDEALSMPPEEIDGFEELWDLYADIATTYGDRVWGIVELDQGGVEHKPRTRERIERELGVVPIPVYHPLLDGWDYYDTIAANYDRMCFGNIVQAHFRLREKLVYMAYERGREYPHLWTHLLGMYPSNVTLSLPMRGSMDASSWLKAVRWQPSWRGWSMLSMVTPFPKTMWSHSGSQGEDYDRAHGEQLCIITSEAAQTTMDHVLADRREIFATKG